MTAAPEVRDLARTFGWQIHIDERRHEDTFVHGQHMVTVDYRRDGTVDRGYRYEFTQITHPRFQERTGVRNKKSAVLSWLVSLGH